MMSSPEREFATERHRRPVGCWPDDGDRVGCDGLARRATRRLPCQPRSISRMGKIGVLDMLSLSGFPQGARAKMVRHQGGKYAPEELARRGWLDAYLSTQKRPIFDGFDYVISFVGLD